MSNFHLKFKIQWLSLTAAFNWRERCGWGWRQTAAMEIKQVCRVCGQFCRRTYWPTQVAAQRAASLPLRGWAALWNLKWKNVMSALAGQQLKELPLNGGTFFSKNEKELVPWPTFTRTRNAVCFAEIIRHRQPIKRESSKGNDNRLNRPS